MGEYRMPSLGADMEKGVVARWLVAPGDAVHKGDLVATIETEKATIDAEIFEDGVVEALLVKEGQEAPVGAPLATIAPSAPGRRPRRGRQPSPDRVHSPVVRHLAESLGVDLARVAGSGSGGEITRADVEAAAVPATGGRRPGPAVRASPFVRRRARELGVELAEVAGSGPGGIVTLDDLERQGAPPPATAAPAEARRPERGRAEQHAAQQRRIGALMARSKREIPHYYLQATIDLGRAVAFLSEANRERPPERRLLAVALLLKATALAAREVPEVNGFFVDDAFQPSGSVHLGVAVSLREGGLVAPAIHDVEAKGLDEVMAAMRDLVARARTGRLRSSEVADATLTVTSLGDLGVDAVLGVIYPPQVALVGFGAIAERPVAVGGLVGARPVVTASLAGDHRVSDGHRGARFLRALDGLLQDPEKL